jgi:hypothetical protein
MSIKKPKIPRVEVSESSFDGKEEGIPRLQVFAIGASEIKPFTEISFQNKSNHVFGQIGGDYGSIEKVPLELIEHSKRPYNINGMYKRRGVGAVVMRNIKTNEYFYLSKEDGLRFSENPPIQLRNQIFDRVKVILGPGVLVRQEKIFAVQSIQVDQEVEIDLGAFIFVVPPGTKIYTSETNSTKTFEPIFARFMSFK